MRTSNKGISLAIAASLTMLIGCANMSDGQKGAAVGGAAGAVGGAVLTGGSALGTVGGAAVGAVIGHEVNTRK
jgi:osmotically inducible lipoprotein OsmB